MQNKGRLLKLPEAAQIMRRDPSRLRRMANSSKSSRLPAFKAEKVFVKIGEELAEIASDDNWYIWENDLVSFMKIDRRPGRPRRPLA